jgi:hypothetical protein
VSHRVGQHQGRSIRDHVGCCVHETQNHARLVCSPVAPTERNVCSPH